MKIIFFSYSLFLFLFTLFSYAFIDSNLIYLSKLYTGFVFDKKSITTIFYALFIFIFFLFYILFLILVKKHKINLDNVKLLIGITIGILFLAYPAMLSYDIFNYLTTAKVSFFYNENPYIIMPIDFINDQFLSFTRATNKIALYGPLWILISGIPYVTGFGNFLITLFSFKLLVVIFYLGIIILIYKISKSIFSVSFFALNPLVVIETLTSSHNDVIMIFFALLSFFLIIKKRTFFALIFLIFSILIKYATIFLLPIFIYIFWKQHIKKQEINFDKVFYYATFLMLIVFFLSPLREEIYPWYAIWFLTFIALVLKVKFILYSSIIFSFSLLLGYVPYMYRGTYLNPTLVLKTLITFAPPILFSIYYVLKKKI